ncbi:unnamed protein product, partial [Didymodactylos carnosus]
MTSYLFPSSSKQTFIVLIFLYFLPASVLGIVLKCWIFTYILSMLIGYLFSSKTNIKPLIVRPSSYALVTGASAGIGRSICLELAQKKFNLIIVAQTLSALEELANEIHSKYHNINVIIITRDLSLEDSADQLIQDIDYYYQQLPDMCIDILINNAGMGYTNKFLSSSSFNIYKKMFYLHIQTPTKLIYYYLPKMIENNRGRIVNVSSEISYMSSPRAIVYSSTKAYLTLFTTALNYEIQQEIIKKKHPFSIDNEGIVCMLVTPGPTRQTLFTHQESLIFKIPFVNLNASRVAKNIVKSSIYGDETCIPGMMNRLTIWFMTKVPLNFCHLVCSILWEMNTVVNNLKCYVAAQTKSPSNAEDKNDLELKLFMKYLNEDNKQSVLSSPPLLNISKDSNENLAQSYFKQHHPIPKFYEHIPNDVLGRKLREEARAFFLQRKSQEIISSEDANALLSLLEQNASPPTDPDSPQINYEDFKRALQSSSETISNLFPYTIFADLYHNDPYGRVRIIDLYQYTMRKMWYHHSRMGLSLYDMVGQGFLRESDLEDYIYELIPTMQQLAQLQETFYKFYVCTAVRKFFF